MDAIQVSSIKLDSNYRIVETNQQFLDFFNLNNESVINQHIVQIASHIMPNLQTAIQDTQVKQSKSLLLLINHKLSAKKHNSLFMLYIMINRDNEGYTIKLVNWLNWLHNLNQSLESSYKFMEKFNQTTAQSRFAQISEICCFKALYPLLMHVPRKFKTNPLALYDIMNLFVKRDADNIITKDYTRNILSRIQTSIRQETGRVHLEIIDAIKDEKLIMLNYKNNISIVNTTLNESMLFVVEADKLLEAVI